ncbi:hypothetical protein A3Q35_13225 [Aeribacillus pallidus]|uniref:DUF4054 domain-containing protein n=1 Tax=Aeribacillus pallidus TaxID=33936 RepID=UPI0007B475CC|nr:DUF4054 domain-containing protein [Aeribacillus pallidus]KZM54915.1 hypothetical protein A3Q35_13225 [Aeribacillus pallidus]
MAVTTPDRVRSIAKHLSALTDDQLQIIIEDAYQEVKSLGIKKEYEERLSRYLAAHLGSLNIRQTQSESVGPMRKDYSTQSINNNTGLSATPYGQEYERLKNRLTAKSRINLTVI